jgi:hypothetical protein
MRRPPTNGDSQRAPCYDNSMSSENDKNLISFIATTVEAMRARVDTISEQMVTKVDLANLVDRVAAIEDRMATKDDFAKVEKRLTAIEDRMATKDDLAKVEKRLTAIEDRMATKDDLAKVEKRLTAVEDRMATVENRMATVENRMATVEDRMATKDDLARLATVVRGDFGQVHFRFDTLERVMASRFGQVETDISRLRSVVYLLVKDKPDMLRLLGQPTIGETRA